MAGARGIWQYAEVLPEIKSEFRLSLDEAKTPLNEDQGIFFKREDLNPTGSIKDRGLAFQVSWGFENGFRLFGITSSGNAAFSAAQYVSLIPKAKLRVFVSPKINKSKLDLLKKQKNLDLEVSRRPNSSCWRWAKENHAYNLRPSIDSLGATGFMTLGPEIKEQLPEVSAIFIPVSSATAFTGMAEGLRKMVLKPKIYLVQPASCPWLAQHWDHDFEIEGKILADAIVAQSLPRKKQAIELVEYFNGQGLVVDNQEIEKWHRFLRGKGTTVSYEGGLALAGLKKAEKSGLRIGQKPMVILTGQWRGYPDLEK